MKKQTENQDFDRFTNENGEWSFLLVFVLYDNVNTLLKNQVTLSYENTFLLPKCTS